MTALPVEVIKQLAGMANVPVENASLFEHRIARAVETAWRMGKDWSAPPLGLDGSNAAIARVRRTASDLQQALHEIDRDAIAWIESFDPARLRDEAKSIAGYRETAADLLHAASTAEAMLAGTQPGPGRPPRLPGDPGCSAFAMFADAVLAAAHEAGGQLTFDKNEGRGTLVELLTAITPHLPRGFVPKSLPLSMIHRLKAHRTRIAGDKD